MATNVLFPEFIANEALARLYAKSVLIGLVSRDWSPVLATKGESVTILTAEASEVEAGDAPFASDDAAPESSVVTLDQFIRTKPKKISDKVDSMSAIQLADIYAEPIAEALLGHVENALITTALTFAGTCGTEGVAPAGFGPLASDLKQKFDAMLVGEGNRYVVMGGPMENAFHQVFAITSNSGATGEAQQATGLLANKLGMNYFGSPRIPANQAGVAFHKSSIALVTRPLKVPAQAQPGTIHVAQYGGLGIRVRAWYDQKDVASYLTADLLYGVKKLNERGFVILN